MRTKEKEGGIRGRKGGKEEREDGTRSPPIDLPLRGLEAAHKPRRGDAWQRAVGPGVGVDGV